LKVFTDYTEKQRTARVPIIKELIKDITNKKLLSTLLSFTESASLDKITITITTPIGHNGDIEKELDCIKKELDKVFR